MDISEISHKANSRPITNRLHQLDAEEFNAMLDELVNLRSLFADSGIVYSVRIQNNLDSRNLSASTGKPCMLAFTFLSRMRDGLADWESTGESATLTVSVKNATYDSFTVVKTMKVNDAVAMTLDVAKWLTSGANQVMLEAKGEISKKTTAALAYTIQLTSLAISADGFVWWSAYAEDFRIPYRIAGNISKTLVVTVTGSGYSKTYEQDLGTGAYTESPYNYTIPHPKRTGVFKVSAYLRNSDGTIRTGSVAYNVICYIQGATSKLMAVNNVADNAVNWNETAVFDYTVFEGAATTTSVTLKVIKDGKTVFSRQEDALPTQTKHTFVLPLEVETIDDLDFSIVINALSGVYTLMSPLTMSVINSLGYSPTAGASLYINPRTRTNAESNREMLVNEVTGEEIAAKWTNMSWYNDGHTKDADGNSVLRFTAGSMVDTGLTVLKPESARAGKLIEMEYKADNVTDFDTPIIDCSEPHMGSFIGFRIYPDRVVVNTAAQKIEDNQSFKFNTGDRIHFALAVMPDIYGNTDFNLCKLFVDGVVNREFSYASNDYFLTESTLKIGSDYADIDIYGIRVFNNSISADGVLQNRVSWRSSNDEKALIKARNDVYDAAGTGIDIEKVRKIANVIVFEGQIPSKRNPGKFRNNWDVLWRDRPEWNIFIKNILQDSQGTSAKEYDDHNQRGKADSQTTWSRLDGTSGTGAVPYIPGLPAIKKWTNKINWASSPHCNKMGSVNSIHDLCELQQLLNEVNARAAIWQEPFVGFQRTWNEEGEAVYTFLGLYTGGPDKGDLASLGLDTAKYPDLLFVEGADNAAPGALFKVPWNPAKGYWKYNADEESMQYNGINCWDYDGGAAESQADVQALYEKVWLPRYNFVYQCSHQLTYWSGTVDKLNSASNILLHRNDDTEFWVAGGDVYYYESAVGKFVPSDIGSGTINLFTQLVDKGYGLTSSMCAGKTNAELNTLFSAARVMKFNMEAPTWFHKGASIFSRNWMEFFAGSDNRAKNTYFIMLGAPASGYLCYLFYDDTDTIGPWTNQGQDKKGYWVEVGDKYDNGQPVWNGEQNRFYNLIDTAWPEDIKEEMRSMMSAMITLSGAETGNSSERLYSFVHKYYFAKAQEYFPEVLYNSAARVMYEDAKLAYIAGTYTNDTDPITQSMGNYYSGWKRWIKYRIQYMQSKYMFGDYAATGGDSIVVRASGNDITYDITPAIWLYPCVATGTSIMRGSRTKAGEVCQITISLGGAADQQTHIKGAHYLQSIGGWWDKNVTGQMIVVGRMLRELRIGHETADIVISIDTLTIRDTPSLQLLDVRRVASLAGVLDLSVCTHIRYVYAAGTAVTQIALPGGGPLQHIEYSSLNQYLILRNFPLLKSEGVVITECLPVISDFLIENCSGLNPIDLLRSILAAQAAQTTHSLKRVRAVGFNETYDTDGAAVLDDLAKLADGSYVGLDSSGLAGSDPYPVLDGELTINTFCYEDSVLALRQIFTRLTINISGGFYIRFADPEVLRVLLANGVGDGVGITTEAVENITDIKSWFKQNTAITSFDELEKFIGLTYLAPITNSNNGFFGCTNLESIRLPKSVTEIGYGCFRNCSKLKTIGNTENVRKISNYTFSSSGLEGDVNYPNLQSLTGYAIFSGTNIERILSLGYITSIPNGGNTVWYGCFYGCKKLKSVVLPDTLTTIGSKAFRDNESLSEINFPNGLNTIEEQSFYNCTSLEIEDLRLPNLQTLGQNAFYGVKIKKMVLGKEGGSLALPNGTTSTQNYGDKNILEEIELKGVISIPQNSFQEYKKLTNVILPSSLTTLGGNAFFNCSELSIDASTLPKSITSIDYGCFYKTKLYGEVDLPNLSGTVAYGTFHGTQISKIKSLGTVSSFSGAGASMGYPFQNCTALTEISQSVWDNIVSYDNSFQGCTSLYIDEFRVPNLEKINPLGPGPRIRSIRDLGKITALWGDTQLGSNHPNAYGTPSAVEEFFIPKTVTSIGRYAFNGLVNLDFIVSYPTTPPTLSANAGLNSSNCPIYVPDASVTAYREASGWVNYADRIKPVRECTIPVSIADENVLKALIENFDVNYNEEFDLGDMLSVKSLNYVFANNQDISNFDELEQFTSLNGFESGTSPYWGDFHGCSLISTKLPKHITVLPNYLFLGSANLKSVGDMRHITRIGNRVFQNTSLEGDLILPNLTSILAGAFNNTRISRILDLGTISNLENWNSDARGVFSNCDKLTTVILPSTLTSIGSGAFEVSGLTTLIMKSTTPPRIGENAFKATNLTNGAIYVPDDSLSAYQSSFSSFASRVKPISQFQTDNPDLYEEVAEYL